MTFNYDPAILATPEDPLYPIVRARLIIGDTTESRPLLQDEEIDSFLETAPTFYEGVARSIEAILARFASEASFSVGNLRVELERRAERMRSLASTVRGQASANKPGAPESMTPWTKGFFRPGRRSCTRDDITEIILGE